MQILRRHFGVEARIVEHVPQWVAIERSQRCTIRATRPTLRVGAVALGAAVRDAQSRFRIVLGPLSLDAYRRFLPGGPHARQLTQWVREYVGIEFDWDVQLELAADAVPAIALGAPQGIGRTAWLGQRLDPGPARDLVVRYDGAAAHPSSRNRLTGTVMSDIGRANLFGKLNPFLYETLEQATGFCRLRGNPYVELAHWFKQMLQRPDGDLQRVLRHFGVDDAAIDRGRYRARQAPRGAGSVSDLSVHIDDAVERAWVYATLKYDATRIRGAVLLLAILKTPQLRNVLLAITREFERIVPDVLADDLASIVEGSPEAPPAGQAAPGGDMTMRGATAAAAAGSALARFAVDLTARARAGEIDPVIGRDPEIRQIVDILLRRRQNNPLLVGEAGVGKTAVAEGFALRIAAGDVPPSLQDVALYLLDIGLLQAGASVKGEFESRLRGVIDEAMSSERPAILFIDEVHTLVGAGGPPAPATPRTC